MGKPVPPQQLAAAQAATPAPSTAAPSPAVPEHRYSGRALVGVRRITLLDLVDNGLPDMLGQLDIAPGAYHLELRLVPIARTAGESASCAACPAAPGRPD